MTARLRGNHKALANRLSLSPELQAVLRLFGRVIGENALHRGRAEELVKTISALTLTEFRIDQAAMLLGESSVAVRNRVHRLRLRVLDCLRGTSFVMPVRPSIGQNEERWDPRTFDEHGELGIVEVEVDEP